MTQIVVDYLVHRREHGDTGEGDGGGVWGFCARTGERIIKNVCRDAGLPEDISAHWMRHSFATHAYESGAPAKVVQRDLGHVALTSTGDYLHTSESSGTRSANFLKNNSKTF